MSASIGNGRSLAGPRGRRASARWTNSLSVEPPSTRASRSANSLVQLAEPGDLGRADEGEVLRPEEDDLPLAGIGGVEDLGEGLAGAAEALGAGLDGGQREGRELVANGQHAGILSVFRCTAGFRSGNAAALHNIWTPLPLLANE